MFNITVDDSKLTLFIDFSSKKMVRAVQSGINNAGMETASYVKTRHLTGGTTEDRLGIRSGLLRASAHGMKAVISGDRIIGGTGLGDGLVYAPIHIKPEAFGGTKTTIRAKGSGSLAIPLRGWASRGGVDATGVTGYGAVKRTSPRDYSKGFLVPFKTRKGNMLLVHKIWSRGTKKKKGAFGKYAIGGKCTIIPYYLLMKSVVVPARVFPERVLIVRRRYIVETIKNEMMKVFGSSSGGGSKGGARVQITRAASYGT